MRTSLPHTARIRSVSDENARIRTLTLDLHLEASPGQFVMAWLPGVDEKPFSLVEADPVTLTIANVGQFTEAVHRLGPGDRLWIRGPLGQAFSLPEGDEGRGQNGQARAATSRRREQGALLLIAGGYGVAPLHFLAMRAAAAGWGVRAVIGARSAEDVIFAGRFEALGARVKVTTDDGSLGQPGLATDAAARLLEQEVIDSLYACGPEPMLKAVEQLALARRLPAELSYERMMRCGFGVCGSCSHDGWLVCRDGPVRRVHP